jgi:hypothetical protein
LRDGWPFFDIIGGVAGIVVLIVLQIDRTGNIRVYQLTIAFGKTLAVHSPGTFEVIYLA